ncbi:hypothetical protein [Brevibacillus sp. SYSU BS000544]|uniref:hypothetical protein n=1 Tax=Brevibacillus sp. SYSU BS000544 TaxID=3416443 RepID=UPI003CE4F461
MKYQPLRFDSSTIQEYEDRMHKHLFKAYGYYRAIMQMKGLPYLQFHQFVRPDHYFGEDHAKKHSSL